MLYLPTIKSNEDLKKLNYNQKRILAHEIRNFLIESVSKTGGHLASNLGVVELTIALHSVFNPEKDAIVWDVGHQSYTHKLLLGRMDEFKNLRQFGGMSGFPKIEDNKFDSFNTGHSSTSISAALGIAYANALNENNNKSIAIIGDGSLTGGLSFEGMNNAGRFKKNFIVILNDNEMSIGKNVGGLSKYLNKIRTGNKYLKAKTDIKHALLKLNGFGKATTQTIHKIKSEIKKLIIDDTIFSKIGFKYFGPIDGHNIEQLEKVLEAIKSFDEPVILHIITKKGKGYKYAENNPSLFHGIGKFDVSSGQPIKSETDMISASKEAGNELLNIAKINKKVVAITAAMADGTGLKEFSKSLPKQFFDVGISEQHAVTFSGGLSKGGLIPVVCIYSTFLQRAYDCVFHDVCLMNLHVVFLLDRAGISGNDGPTHHGVFDISYLIHIPNIEILAPSDINSLKGMINYAVNECKSPVAIRYPKALPDKITNEDYSFKKAEILKTGSKLTLIGVGDITNELLKLEGDFEIIDLKTIKPFDKETILNSYKKTGKIVVVENGSIIGGAGSYIENELDINVKKIGVKDEFVPHGSIRDCMKFEGLSYDELQKTIDNYLL